MPFKITEELRNTISKLAKCFHDKPLQDIARYAEDEYMIPFHTALCTLLILIGMELTKE